MGIRRQSSTRGARLLGAGIAATCALAGLCLTPVAQAQQAPAPTTNLGTMVVTPAQTNAPVLAPARTTVQRSALKFKLQPAHPTRPSHSPAIPARKQPAANPIQLPAKPRPQSTTRTPPQALHIVAPKYPRAALAQALRGSVKVSFTIEPDGHTGDVHIVSSQPARVFDEATLQAVRQWRFEPATVNGRPVATTATQAIVFNPPLQQEQAPTPPPQPVPVQAAPPPRAKPPPDKIEIHPIHIVAPEYPPQAYRRRIGGSVTVQFVVGTDGKTHHIKVVKAEPRSIFNRAAKEAVRKWRFQPVKTPTSVTQTIRFTPPGG